MYSCGSMYFCEYFLCDSKKVHYLKRIIFVKYLLSIKRLTHLNTWAKLLKNLIKYLLVTSRLNCCETKPTYCSVPEISFSVRNVLSKRHSCDIISLLLILQQYLSKYTIGKYIIQRYFFIRFFISLHLFQQIGSLRFTLFASLLLKALWFRNRFLFPFFVMVPECSFKSKQEIFFAKV